MNLPFRKCKCCGRRIGLLEWWRHTKEAYSYISNQMIFLDKEIPTKEKIRILKERYNSNHISQIK